MARKSTSASDLVSVSYLEPKLVKWQQPTYNLMKKCMQIDYSNLLIFLFLHRELFDLRKIYVVNLKTGRPKKMPYVGEFSTWDLSEIENRFKWQLAIWREKLQLTVH